MKTVEYDEADSLGILHLNLLSLGFALTPERAAQIRRLDARPFPFFALYAVEDEIVAGQVGVFRLPVVTTQGPEDAGGVWAVCTHPAFSGRGIATRLMAEAHARMRAAGLRFSTLGTSRHRRAYSLYRRLGYEDAAISGSALAPREKALRDTRLQAGLAGRERLHLADALFRQVAVGRLGFARRHEPFFPALIEIGDVDANEVWLLWEGDDLAGYALARVADSVLRVNDLVLREGVDAAEAVAALARQTNAPYLQVNLYRPSEAVSLQHAGYQLARPDWSTFMIKPLTPEMTAGDARHLFGIGTEQFLMSWMDMT
jgi:ribosomal protein S18 acetylase RimI-like enzyme